MDHSATHAARRDAGTLPAFQAIRTWYELRTTVQPILGDRLTLLFAHAVSAGSESPSCAAYFRRLLTQAGEDPDAPTLDQREAAVVAYGRCLGDDPYRVPAAAHAGMAEHFDGPDLVALATFGALMVATRVLNTTLELPLADYIGTLRRAEVY
jgi:hypothetical protein